MSNKIDKNQEVPDEWKSHCGHVMNDAEIVEPISDRAW